MGLHSFPSLRKATWLQAPWKHKQTIRSTDFAESSHSQEQKGGCHSVDHMSAHRNVGAREVCPCLCLKWKAINGQTEALQGRPARAHPWWGGQAALASATRYPCTRVLSSVLYPPVHRWNHLQLKSKKAVQGTFFLFFGNVLNKVGFLYMPLHLIFIFNKHV